MSNPVLKIISVILLIAITLFALKILVKNNELFKKIVEFKAPVEKSSQVLGKCKKLNDVFFAKDYFDQMDTSDFQALISKNGFYQKTILFCGALIEITDNLNNGNLNNTLSNLQKDYQNFNIEISPLEINKILKDYSDVQKQEIEIEKYLATQVEKGIGDYYG